MILILYTNQKFRRHYKFMVLKISFILTDDLFQFPNLKTKILR